jgi:23S rRNA pseudouridine2457 synthase
LYKYFLVYKPFNVLSRFTSDEGKKCLKDFFVVPKDIYPVGRLDYDSEGLLLMTNDSRVNEFLLNPIYNHERTYWVQVEGRITKKAADAIQEGVVINIRGVKTRTKKCKVELIDQPHEIAERRPPIRVRKNIPDSWIRLILTEGKNRQVRKMTAKVGYPTLRLIRYSIGNLTIGELKPGEMKEISQPELYNLLRIKKNTTHVTFNDRFRKS